MYVPEHIAIIMDGNGRWAKEQGKPRTFGHYNGTNNVRNIAIKANELGVKVLTLYAFSTENWKRPMEEVEYLMSLPEIFIQKFLKELMEKNIRIEMIGRWDRIPVKTANVLKKAIEQTKDNTAMTLVFAMNYGGRDDIVYSVNKCIEEGINNISEEDITNHLMTSQFPEIDLLIRTSLDYRLSNFLLWQLSYAELYFVDCYWPDFNEKQLEEAIIEFNKRNRRFGGLN